MDKPWIVIDSLIADPARVIKEYGEGLSDLRNACSEGETRIVDGRSFADADVDRSIDSALRQASELISISYTSTEPVWLLRYSVGGHYVWHGDNELLDFKERKLSVIIALNEEYEGGNTEFMWPRPGYGEIVHLEPGSGVIFPSFMFHRALPVTSGERWVLLTFGVGQPFR